MSSEINLTLEGLYDILRNEKSREELQELPKSFYLDVASYVRQKKVLLDSRKDEDELFASSDKKKLEYEVRSIKRILKEIYGKREKKILDIAMNKSRTRSDIIDTSCMLTEERLFYEKIVKVFDFQRNGVLLNLFRGELPTVLDGNVDTSTYSSTSEKPVKKKDIASFEDKKVEKEIKTDSKEVENKKEGSAFGSKISVKFLHPVPRFIWKDMKEYGPFEKDQKIELYKEIGELLAKKGRAQVV
ncbi:DNA replication complex GINS family protein [archaeon]|nr:DNA replication complex GINS family protein [archaeon]MBT6698437.1 DNA replication complex GINS family protein [archaeon]